MDYNNYVANHLEIKYIKLQIRKKVREGSYSPKN